MPPLTLQALNETHTPAIIEACAEWEELAGFGAPTGGRAVRPNFGAG